MPVNPDDIKNPAHGDPAVEDTTTTKDQQLSDLYSLIDTLAIGLLTTHRPSIGLVSRSMAVGQRIGPDLLFFANKNSSKFQDLAHSPAVQVTFQDSTTYDWISIAGEARTSDHSDPRIRQYWSKGTGVWFGDLGDGTYDGGPDDPRLALIEVRARHVVYWKRTVGKVGFVKEVGLAALTGGIADTGVTRELGEGDLEMARGRAEGR